MNKLTDAEIVKAFEICLGKEAVCQQCPYDNYSYRDCMDNLLKDTLDLIKRKDAEIEDMQKNIQCVMSANVRLINEVGKAKSEAIKEFAEKLKCRSHRFKTIDRIFVDCIPLDYIDNLVKEMVGDEND